MNNIYTKNFKNFIFIYEILYIKKNTETDACVK